MQNKTPMYIVLSLLLLGAAAGITWFLNRPTDQLAPEQTITDWLCDACGEKYSLTDSQLASWEADPKRFETRQIERMASRFSVYLCDKCNQMAVVRAQECSTHGTFAVTRHLDGTPGGCAQCIKEAGGRR